MQESQSDLYDLKINNSHGIGRPSCANVLLHRGECNGMYVAVRFVGSRAGGRKHRTFWLVQNSINKSEHDTIL